MEATLSGFGHSQQVAMARKEGTVHFPNGGLKSGVVELVALAIGQKAGAVKKASLIWQKNRGVISIR